jgi:hypothetical protein
VNVEGKVYRAGDVFEYERGDTTAQLLSAGARHRDQDSEESSGGEALREELTASGRRAG